MFKIVGITSCPAGVAHTYMTAKALVNQAKENGMEAFISLEERMACGVGACLGCVAKTVDKDHHTHVNNTCICVEGPVFNSEVVDI